MNLGTDFHGWDGSSVITNVWHKGPTMVVDGEATFSRSSASDSNVSYYVKIKTIRKSGSYGYPVTACVIFGGGRTKIADTYSGTTYYGYTSYGGSSYGDKGNSGEVTIASTGGTSADYVIFSGSVQCTDNNTNLDVLIWCNGGGTHDCDSGTWGHPNIIVGSMNTNDITHYNPHQQPSISLSLPSGVNTWTKQGSSTSIHCDWNRNDDPHNHNIVIKRGGSSGTEIYNQNSGSDNGSFNQSYTTPTTRDSKYNIWAKITDTDDGNYNASTTYERGVYGLPSISVSLANSNKIIVNTPNKITVSVGSLTNDNGSPEKVWITVNGSTVKTWTNLSTGTSYTGNNALTFNYTPTVDGETYEVIAYVEHGYSGEQNNASKTFKTYVTPVVGNISGTTPFSPQDNISYSWSNNSSSMSGKGESSKQTISITGSNKENVTHSQTSVMLAPSGTYWVQIFTN